MFLMFLFNCLIKDCIADQAQSRLLSISSSFLRKMPPSVHVLFLREVV